MDAKRIIYNKLCDDLDKPEISILLGARQVGKTYLLRKVEEFARKSGKTTAYFNLEIPDDLLKFTGSESDTFHFLTTAAQVLFIDEFHYLKNASHLFKAVFDSRHNVKIFASGSSSIEIHKHLKESLAGRRRIHRVFPLSIREYKINDLSPDSMIIEGSLPGLLKEKNAENKQNYLRDLLETYILKDIKSLIKEENIRAFNHLLYLLAENQGAVVSVSNLSGEVGLTARSIERYLTILEQTYVCFSLPSFSTNQGNELKKSRKYFFYDIGIRNAIIKNFERVIDRREDKGVLYESIIFLQLLQKISPDTSLYFWRTKQKSEVDFIKVTNRQPIPIEVKSDLKQIKIPDGLKAFLKSYPLTAASYIVNTEQRGELRYQNIPVKFILWTDIDQI
ncbi:MAG: ATP-binding protein [Candidatus Aureabacteria bacterium]|nr:ATP-binding protein [Candidatus Auribacterota bacterium]